ncbi:MAG: hypothetical protein NT120_01750 [Candidatus Aenigmarchaeota archaeon]|nr:hypothetical protein [Candidatus Aenigmarchaeota archaeon]
MYKKRMSLKNRVLSSVVLFFLLLVIFKTSIIEPKCPAISCTAPTGCIGACYSVFNIYWLAVVLVVSLVVPAVIYRTYIKHFW